ncbi:MAG: hypothetical protein WCL38_02170 [Actinomycetota bacterium]
MIVTRITIIFGLLLSGFVVWMAFSGFQPAVEFLLSAGAVVVLIVAGSKAFPALRALPKFRRPDLDNEESPPSETSSSDRGDA